MDVVTNLDHLAKAELVALIYELQRENASLKQAVQRLTERLHPPKRPLFSFAHVFHRAKRPGQKPGHPGMTRATPIHVRCIAQLPLRR